MRSFFTVLAISLGLGAATASADSSCTAENEEGGSCSITCEVGSAAQCQDTTAGNKPICVCAETSAENSDTAAITGIMTGELFFESATDQIADRDIGVIEAGRAKCGEFDDHRLPG